MDLLVVAVRGLGTRDLTPTELDEMESYLDGDGSEPWDLQEGEGLWRDVFGYWAHFYLRGGGHDPQRAAPPPPVAALTDKVIATFVQATGSPVTGMIVSPPQGMSLDDLLESAGRSLEPVTTSDADWEDVVHVRLSVREDPANVRPRDTMRDAVARRLADWLGLQPGSIRYQHALPQPAESGRSSLPPTGPSTFVLDARVPRRTPHLLRTFIVAGLLAQADCGGCPRLAQAEIIDADHPNPAPPGYGLFHLN